MLILICANLHSAMEVARSYEKGHSGESVFQTQMLYRVLLAKLDLFANCISDNTPVQEVNETIADAKP